MGRRGPKPKNDDELELEGKPPRGTGVHKKYDVIPEPPEWLDQVAQSIYIDVCTILHEAGILTTADHFAIELFADGYSQWIAAVQDRDASAAQGYISPEKRQACRSLAMDMNRWIRTLGLGPAYRPNNASFGLGGEETNKAEIDDPIILGICGT